MTDELETIEGGDPIERTAPRSVTAGEGRRVDIRLVSWGDVADIRDQGYRETIARGAFAGADPRRVVVESQKHGGAIVGVGEEIIEREDGAYATVRIASTAAGDELLQLIRDEVMTDTSVVARPLQSRRRPDGVIERQSLDLMKVAIAHAGAGAYKSSQVLMVRTAPDKENEPVTDLAPDIIERMESLSTRVDALATLSAVPSASDSPFAKYPDMGEYAKAVFRGEVDEVIQRTFADQITSQNDGIAQTGWIMDIKRIVFLGRRAINAFGGPAPLPDHGMTVTYPFLTSANTLVGVQSTQKTEIQSARVDIDDGTGTVATYAGGSDIAIQLIERGAPSYLNAYQRIMTNYWAGVTDAAFVTALEAGSQTQTMGNALGPNIALANPSAASDDILDTSAAHGLSIGDAVVFTSLTGGTGLTAGTVYWVVATSFAAQTFRVASTPGGTAIGFSTDITAGNVNKVNTTAAGLRSSLFAGSVQVESATGAPASVALASTDVFLALAGLTDIVPNYNGNPSNASGLAQANTLSMNINGLDIIHKSSVSAGKVILSNPIAAQWLEDGPRWLTADNAQKLGKDYSIYSYGVGMVYVPAGVVEMTFV